MSIWLDNYNNKSCYKLDKDIDADVLIIGGGITGLSTFYELLDSNLNVVLVEKNRVGMGVSARTTGKLTYLQDTIYSDLAKTYNKETAKLYYESQISAIKRINEIVKKEKIECNLENDPSYLFTNSEKDVSKIDKEKNMLKSFGVPVKEAGFLPDGLKVKKAISVSDTYTYHPVKYINALKNICISKQKIYENTKVLKIDKKDIFICQTDTNIIRAKKVVIAMHYPYFLFPFLMPLKTSLEKSYLSAYKVNSNLHFSAINVEKPTISIRYFEDYKIVLSNSHNLAFKNNDKNNFNDLKGYLPTKPYKVWSNKDIITSDKIPYIGMIKEGLYLATGFNTWGMTNGILSGMILKDLILNNENKYKKLFNPKRGFNINQVISYPINIISTVKSFLGSKINKNKSWYSSKIKFEVRNGVSVAVFIDDKGNKHVVRNICPHLKCSLIFNEEEKTWDCPCHGSRFDIDGKCIEGPSNFDICYRE